MNLPRMVSILCVLALLTAPAPGVAGPFVAFSLTEASKRAEAGHADGEVDALAGITRIVGMVQDPGTRDVILVGRRLEGRPALSLEDLVVALRARLQLVEWPTVSIDPVESTARTGLQQANFTGGIGGTQVGQKFLAADVYLKRYSLELVRPVEPAKSYRFLVGKASRERLVATGLSAKSLRWQSVDNALDALAGIHGSPTGVASSHQVRFWFYPSRPRLVAREGVFCISELRIGVTKEIFGEASEGSAQEAALEVAADRFAQGVAENLPALAGREPDIGWLKGFFDLLAVAEGIRVLPQQPDLSYLVQRFPVPAVENSWTFPLLMVRGLLERSDGTTEAILISGGVRLQTEIEWLNEGDVTPLRDLVMKARPAPNAVSWELPLDGWEMPNGQDLSAKELKAGKGPGKTPIQPGFSLRTQTVLIAPPGHGRSDRPWSGFSEALGAPALKVRAPSMDYLDRLGGVVINTVTDEAKFHPDPSGNLDALRQRVLRGRTGPASLVFPAR